MVITEEEFKSKFKNKNLEPYAESVYRAMFTVSLLQNMVMQKNKFESDLVSILQEALGILYVIEDMISGEFTYKRMPISDPQILGMVKADWEMAYRYKIELYRKELDERQFDGLSVGEYPAVFSTIDNNDKEHFSNVVFVADEEDIRNGKSIPETPIFGNLFGKDGRYDIKQFIIILEDVIKKCQKKSQYDKELAIKAFMKKTIEIGIPKENKYYVELYECLVLIDAIDAKTLASHNASTDPYAIANFMKARYNRLLKGGTRKDTNNLLEFLVQVDENNPESCIVGI